MNRRICSLLLTLLLTAPALSATALAASPNDVPPDAPYAEGVTAVLEAGLIPLRADGRFAPEEAITRLELTEALWSLAGQPVVNYAMNLSDVDQGDPGAEAVRWAVSTGIATGYSDGSFGPAHAATREQMAAMLYRYAKEQGQGFTGMWMFPLDCSDAQEIHPWAYEPLCWLTMRGVLSVDADGALAPRAAVSRGEAATVLTAFRTALEQ